MKIKYITIEREYGSGGTKIARFAAEKSGVPCYGKEILENVSQKLHTTAEKIERYEETVSNSVLYSLFALGKANSGDSDLLSAEGHIFIEEQAAICEFAKQGRAIFLGHCASEALREQSGVIKVFIYGNQADKEKRIICDYGIPENTAANTAKKYDKKRANYYFANTAKDWSNLRNYDIVLNSSAVGEEKCAEILCALLKSIG